jgi:hypothetical protein
MRAIVTAPELLERLLCVRHPVQAAHQAENEILACFKVRIVEKRELTFLTDMTGAARRCEYAPIQLLPRCIDVPARNRWDGVAIETTVREVVLIPVLDND